MPYGRLKNTEVVERVQRGIVLEKPKNCPKEVYETMKRYVKWNSFTYWMRCWFVDNILSYLCFIKMLGPPPRRKTILPNSQRATRIRCPSSSGRLISLLLSFHPRCYAGTEPLRSWSGNLWKMQMRAVWIFYQGPSI